MFARLADLPLTISSCHLEPLVLATSGGWQRHTTVIHLEGDGRKGAGEDVIYDEQDQALFQAIGALPLAGSWTLAEFSEYLDQLPLFPEPPTTHWNPYYRRWGIESAALDLALQQAGTSLAKALGREPRPVSFAVSLGLGDPPTLAPMEQVCARVPGMRFKVDLAANWTEDTVAALAAVADSIAVVDLKGQYRGAFAGPPANAEQYRWIGDQLPEVWIEDPELNDETDEALAPHRDRITWDAILHSVANIESLPFPPRCINVKPSRFGTVKELLRVYDYCESQGIRMYGGGQFELGPGRGHIQYLASLFHPNEANDVAPGDYNRAELPAQLPASPLPSPESKPGFSW